jgi:hypothetical protein
MKALNNNYKSLDIKDSDFESKKPKASFFEKLNKLTTETPETTATATAAAESQTKAAETENINYTKLIE